MWMYTEKREEWNQKNHLEGKKTLLMSNVHLIFFFFYILCMICTELCSSVLEDAVNLHLLLQTRKHQV